MDGGGQSRIAGENTSTSVVLGRGSPRAGHALGCKKKDFIQAKFDFVDEMAKWSEAEKPAEVLDVGAAAGVATWRTFGEGTTVTGITLSPNQVKRATELAKDRACRTRSSGDERVRDGV